MILDRNIDVHKKIKWTVNGQFTVHLLKNI